MIEARDDRTPVQRRWETACKWIGVTTGAAVLGSFSEDAGRAYMNSELAEEMAQYAIPHEALSDTELNERWFEVGAWAASIGAIALLCAIAWNPDWAGYLGVGAVLLIILSIWAWRKQSRVEDEIALETSADVMARWEHGEANVVRTHET